jgi:hypothetical protein
VHVQKPRKTLADYLVIAISPALIMVLVGSLGLFLVGVCYRGETMGGLRWMLFWFVLAIVLVSRIGIEQSSGHAQVYGLLLAGATWLYLARTYPAPGLGVVLLGGAWWCAHRLTMDCTLIDEEDDASGEGLLRKAWSGGKEPASAPADPSRSAGRPFPAPKEKKRKKISPPGVWVVYFSLAALPLFGVGQMLLPADDTAARRAALAYVVAYLAAALGLLLTTSFLGLRRYLRQRYLAMPANIALGWIRFGVSVAVAVLLIAMIVPRPGAGTAWRTLSYRIDQQLRKASDYAMRFNTPGKGEGRLGNRPGGEGQEGRALPRSDTGEDGSGESQSARHEISSGEPGPSSQDALHGPRDSVPRPGVAGNALHSLLRILTILMAIGLVGWWIVRHRETIAQLLRAFMTSLRRFLEEMLGLARKRPRAGAAPAIPKAPVFHPFDTFRNPFQTGNDPLWPPDRLVLYTYAGLQAWAVGHGIVPGPQQTPREFCVQLGEGFPDIEPDLESLSFFYAHAAFGRQMPTSFQPEPLQRLWRYMRSVARPPRMRFYRGELRPPE